jgi:hypothetical protein
MIAMSSSIKEDFEHIKGISNNFFIAALSNEYKTNKVGVNDANRREQYISSIWQNGGKDFVERVKLYGRTERGTEIVLSPWYSELLEGLGDFRISRVFCTGAAQIGKTLAANLLLADTLVYGRCNTGIFWQSLSSLTNNAPVQYQPIVESYVEAMERNGYRFSRFKDRMTSQRYMVQGVTSSLSYVSTSRTSDESGLAAVGGAAASFTADFLSCDEVSQYAPGAIDPLPRRVDASLIATKPIRFYGTPGSGGGIEALIEKEAAHDFYPACNCPSCKEDFFLDPFGCLLKKITRLDSAGNTIESYVTDTNRPKEWWHTDENDPVYSAYIACAHCGSRLENYVLESARYKCRITGIWFRDFIDSIPPGIPNDQKAIAFNISPLTRKSKINLAADIIRSGLEATDSRDFIQQRLGHPSRANATCITMEILKRSIEAPSPLRSPEVRLAGVDVGRGQYWLSIANFTPPEDWNTLATEEIIERTIVEYVFLNEISVNELAYKLKEYNVEYGLIDNEPERYRAAEFKRSTVLEIADQINNLKDNVKEVYVEEGGNKIPCYQIRNERFVNQVLMSFISRSDDGYPIARLPKNMERWVANPSENNPLRHLCSPRYDPYLGKFVRTDHIDDLYFASVFMQAAYYIWLTRKTKNTFKSGNLVTLTNSSDVKIGGHRKSFIPSVRRF